MTTTFTNRFTSTTVTPQDWVKALESGEYKRGIGRLRNSDGAGGERHCCLGVLNDLIGAPTDWTEGALVSGWPEWLGPWNPGDSADKQPRLAHLNDSRPYEDPTYDCVLAEIRSAYGLDLS